MMNEQLEIWLYFLLCVGVIGYAGAKISKYGDVIADKTGLGGSWVGLIMLGTVTSLPELVTGISSVTVAEVPDIALGDIMGSCVYNLMIIVILDVLYRRSSVYTVAGRGHILSAGFGVMLIGFAGFGILLSSSGLIGKVGHIGWYSIVIVVLYGVAMRTVYSYEARQIEAFTEKEADRYPGLPLRQAILRYLGAAVLVVAAGSFLPFVAKDIAILMGWHEGFVGTMFVAFVTSLPELVVTVSALRMGAIDMAIGNLFGSNLFNILIIAIDDLFYMQGPILADISPTHAISAFSAMMMTGVAIVGLLYHPKTRVLNIMGWVSVFLFAIYIINTYVMFLHGSA
jgi:cation:H+ antiporter